MDQNPQPITSQPGQPIMPLQTPPPTRPNTLGMIVAASIVVGGLAGGAVSYVMVGTTPGRTLINDVAPVKTVQVQEESATIDVVKKASPAVVSIVATKDYKNVYQEGALSPFDQFFFGSPSTSQPAGKTQVCSGSGFIVQKDGYIVTNNHVLCDDTAQYSVVMNDGKKYDAKVMATDTVNDIAVIKIEADNLPTLALSNSDQVQIGQSVIAIGNALGQYRNTVTRGVISGLSRTITASNGSGQAETLENVFQTDASINPGNSGGPLLDLTGSVIAINTAVDQQGQLIGFAIPSNVAKKDIDSVLKTGKIVQPYLGIRYIPVTKAMADQNKLPVEYGALIQRGTGENELAVVSGSPADKVGLVENDIIVSIDGTELKETKTLSSQLAKHQPGDQITLTIYHQGDKKDVKVTLGERPTS